MMLSAMVRKKSKIKTASDASTTASVAAGTTSSAKLLLLINPKATRETNIKIVKIFFTIFPLKRVYAGFTGANAINLF